MGPGARELSPKTPKSKQQLHYTYARFSARDPLVGQTKEGVYRGDVETTAYYHAETLDIRVNPG